ncbi:hypothetical protein ACJZ2D_005585 [Fusarium nematophilum]
MIRLKKDPLSRSLSDVFRTWLASASHLLTIIPAQTDGPSPSAMDPLSVLASVAGIATAGAALANTLFRLIRTAHHAPREIQSIAIEISSLTSALEHLHDILANGSAFIKPSFLQGVRAVVTNIKATQEDISKMISDQGVFARIKWMKATGLLSDIEKHKVTITLQTSILSAAILVKSTTSSRTQQQPENRFRLQAETLVQAGQASIECDNLPRSYPEAPSERAPSPPVRTDKRLPSPVRRSEIPGHVQSEDLFRSSSRASPVPQNPPVPSQGEASRAAENHAAPSETERADLDSVAAQESALPSDFNVHAPKVSSNDPTYVEGENPRSDDEEAAGRGRGNRPFGAASYPVANFGHHFRVEGDAATFLYKLVFQDEWKDDEGLSVAEDYDEASERDEWTASDTDVTADESERGFGNRVRFESRATHRHTVSQEPARVVDQLLLEWTLLSRGEVERGSASPEVGSDEAWGGETLREEESRPREYSPSPRRNSENSSHPGDSPGGRRVIRPTRTNTPPYTVPLDNPFTRRDGSAPKHPAPLYAPYINTEAPDGVPKRPFMEGYGPRLVQPYWTHPASFQQRGFNPTQANPQDPSWHSPPQPPPPPPSTTDTKPRSKPSSRKPTIIVLPRADTSDYEAPPTSPELDASCLGLKIVQQEEPVLWNSDDFVAKRGLHGKAIMASLVGDKSARHALGMDLAHTLMRGQNTKLVYVRGNDLGETWFINEEPVFLQFYHCGYLPQFYAARDTDATTKREYVAVGEEWASAEAMSQLGLAMKGREDGRVLLEPSVTWSMVRELAITTLQLRCMRQRRQFTPTFYNSIAKFRDTHGEPQPLPLAAPSEERNNTSMPHEEPARSGDQGVDVFNFEVDNWNKEESAGDNLETKVEETPNDQPQILVTPSAMQEPQPTAPELDHDDAKSDASCETLLSRFIHRCKPGRRNSLLSPMARRNASAKSIAGRSGNGEWGGCNDKRDVATASDSGVGTSIV